MPVESTNGTLRMRMMRTLGRSPNAALRLAARGGARSVGRELPAPDREIRRIGNNKVKAPGFEKLPVPPNIAAKGDMWLHTQKIPGSHVIICAEGMEIPDSTLEEAARLAAYHSRARESSNVPVDYTRVKNLKKPVGAKPGKVIYHVYNTAFVTPDSAEAEKLAVKV